MVLHPSQQGGLTAEIGSPGKCNRSVGCSAAAGRALAAVCAGSPLVRQRELRAQEPYSPEITQGEVSNSSPPAELEHTDSPLDNRLLSEDNKVDTDTECPTVDFETVVDDSLAESPECRLQEYREKLKNLQAWISRDNPQAPQMSTGEFALLRDQALQAAADEALKPGSPRWATVPDDPTPALPQSTPTSLGTKAKVVEAGAKLPARIPPTSASPSSSLFLNGGGVPPLWSTPPVGSNSITAAAAPEFASKNDGGYLQKSGRTTLHNIPIAHAGPREVSVHGMAHPPAQIGFVGNSPFWTCGSTPFSATGDLKNLRETNGHERVADHNRAIIGRLWQDWATNGTIAGRQNGGKLSSQMNSAIGTCIDLLAQALDTSVDSTPPEEELTTVRLETKEQRLEWRDFLSEAVSKRCANSLFTSYDVEAEPPNYARPPLSLPTQPGGPCTGATTCCPGSHLQPHIIAPQGAGWNPFSVQAAKEKAALSPPAEAEDSSLSRSSMPLGREVLGDGAKPPAPAPAG